MDRNQNNQNYHEDYNNDREPGFVLTQECKNIMLMLFVFSLIFFIIQFNNVYGTPSDPHDF